jgi:hypothetical protein
MKNLRYSLNDLCLVNLNRNLGKISEIKALEHLLEKM